MNNRNDFELPVLMLIAIPSVMVSYYIIKWAYSSGFSDWIYVGLTKIFSHIFELSIQIVQKAFV
jgi:hypothetical protein